MLEKAYSCIAIVNVNTGSYSENDPFVWQKKLFAKHKIIRYLFRPMENFFFGKYTTDRARQSCSGSGKLQLKEKSVQTNCACKNEKTRKHSQAKTRKH